MMAERRREAVEGGGKGGADGILLGGSGTVDWHDFVVVETIEFDADEVVEALPPPTSLRLAVLKKELQPTSDQRAKEGERDEAVDGGEETEESSSEDEDDVDMDEGDDDDDDDDGGEKLKVVSNYQPKVVSTREITGDASRTHIIDPISGKSIAIADMPEHMRIQLLDPKWAEERKRFLEKQRETNFVAGMDIASNISRFAQARGDIFGSSEADIRDRMVDSERRLMEANRLIREQAMQPQPQPQGPAMPVAPQFGAPPPPPPPSMGMPPAHHPPVFAPPPPLQQQLIMIQPTIPSEEPATKRPKIDESQIDPIIVMAPPPPPVISISQGAVDTGLDPPQPPPPPLDENELLSESDFIATLSDPDDVPICIRVPHDPSNSQWNFNGQTIDIPAKATTTVKDLKAALKEQLGGMPMNKMQLKHPSSGFMNKDNLSLAFLNVGPMTTIDLVPKTRGGRK
jgi:splicing factor 3A subunit 1